jgi:hypothetical protein
MGSMIDFTYHGVELNNDVGDRIIRNGFSGICGLL